MKTGPFLSLAFVLIVFTTACAPRSIYPERDLDPSPLLQAMTTRQTTFKAGVSGTIEILYRGTDGNFRGKAHIIVFPDGPFRIEIPGLMGSTLVIMASDGREVLIYYPGEGVAFRGPAKGLSLGSRLPFPLPVDAAAVPPLLLGSFPGYTHPGNPRSSLLSSGERTLRITGDGTGPQFKFLFSKKDPPALHAYHCSYDNLRLEATTARIPPFFPEAFTVTLPDAELKGKWEKAGLFKKDASALKFKIPGSVPITELEAPL